MKRLLLIFIIIGISTFAFAQKAMTFSNAAKQGVSMSNLDSTYTNAVNADTTVYAVFRNDQEAFTQAYYSFLQNLASYLKEKEFSWGKPAQCFNKIYFNKDGGVDYFLFNFRPGTVTEDQETQFESLLNEFVQNAKFPMEVKEPFSQCAPVTYKDN